MANSALALFRLCIALAVLIACAHTAVISRHLSTNLVHARSEVGTNAPAKHADVHAKHAAVHAKHAAGHAAGHPTSQSTSHPKSVDIRELARGGKVIQSFPITFKNKLPESIPETGYIPPDEYWTERGLPVPKKNVGQTDRLQPCAATETHLDLDDTFRNNAVMGNTHVISDTLCAPGTIGKTYSFSYSWSVNFQAGPDLKATAISNPPVVKNVLDKIGQRAGFAYTFGTATTTSYSKSWNLPQQHPFVLTFRPSILILSGQGREVKTNGLGAICSVGDTSHFTLHIPMMESANCKNPKSACGPKGTYDSCFFLGLAARTLCPGHNLGPTPERGLQCPNHLYDPHFLNRHGGIIS